jgi:hypothetical protein
MRLAYPLLQNAKPQSKPNQLCEAAPMKRPSETLFREG